jgi:hypothetical protein
VAVKTYGLTHAAMAVRRRERTAGFYRAAFGAVVVDEGDGSLPLQTPRSRDVPVFERPPVEPPP